jgi:hypothetical protein
VTSRIIARQGAPIGVDWRLGISDGVYKIKDVAIDGVSMALAQRSEIATLIARGGGQLGMLLVTMRVGVEEAREMGMLIDGEWRSCGATHRPAAVALIMWRMKRLRRRVRSM